MTRTPSHHPHLRDDDPAPMTRWLSLWQWFENTRTGRATRGPRQWLRANSVKVWTLVISIIVLWAAVNVQLVAHRVNTDHKITVRLARQADMHSRESARQSRLNARKIRAQCKRTQDIAPSLGAFLRRMHALDAKQLQEYRATIPKRC